MASKRKVKKAQKKTSKKKVGKKTKVLASIKRSDDIDLVVANRKISELTLNPDNPRIHSKSAIKALAKIIEKNNFCDPIDVADNMVLAGEKRLLAMKFLRRKVIPSIDLSALDQAQREAHVLAHNRASDMSTYDYDMLLTGILKIQDLGLDPTDYGFSPDYQLALMSPEEAEAMAASKDPFAEWKGMPSFDNEAQPPMRRLIINFDAQHHIDEFATLIGQKLTNKTKSVWYPAKTRVKRTGKGYV